MIRKFPNHVHLDTDIYVADYTHYAEDNPDAKGWGVVISGVEPEHIKALKFNNPNKKHVTAVNFEKNEAVFKPDGLHKVDNCECMLVSEEGHGKRWLALVELKYCLEKNIASNFEDALYQLAATHRYLRDDVRFFGPDDFRYYWIISMPEHSDRVPFSAFTLSQDDELKYAKEYNSVIIISDNEVNIWTGTLILQPD